MPSKFLENSDNENSGSGTSRTASHVASSSDDEKDSKKYENPFDEQVQVQKQKTKPPPPQLEKPQKVAAISDSDSESVSQSSESGNEAKTTQKKFKKESVESEPLKTKQSKPEEKSAPKEDSLVEGQVKPYFLVMKGYDEVAIAAVVDKDEVTKYYLMVDSILYYYNKRKLPKKTQAMNNMSVQIKYQHYRRKFLRVEDFGKFKKLLEAKHSVREVDGGFLSELENALSDMKFTSVKPDYKIQFLSSEKMKVENGKGPDEFENVTCPDENVLNMIKTHISTLASTYPSLSQSKRDAAWNFILKFSRSE